MLFRSWGGLIEDQNTLLDKRIVNIEKERDELKAIQRKREESIPALEQQRLDIRQKLFLLRIKLMMQLVKIISIESQVVSTIEKVRQTSKLKS